MPNPAILFLAMAILLPTFAALALAQPDVPIVQWARTANAINISLPNMQIRLPSNAMINFKVNTTNVPPASLDVNGLGQKAIPMRSMHLRTGKIASVVYDVKAFQPISSKEFLDAKADCGAVADSHTDTTSALQNCMRLSADYGIPLHIPFQGKRPSDYTSHLYKITNGLTYSGPQLVFDPLACLGPVGSGYWALTYSNNPYFQGAHNLCADGTLNGGNRGPELNGIRMGNDKLQIGEQRFDQITSINFNGTALQVWGCSDCTYNTIHIESSGNSRSYALVIDPKVARANYTNESHFGHIQVELCNTLCIEIGPNGVNNEFDGPIHSERAIGDTNVPSPTWDIESNQGSRFGPIRVECQNTQCSMMVGGAYTEFDSLFMDPTGWKYPSKPFPLTLLGNNQDPVTIVNIEAPSSLLFHYKGDVGVFTFLGGAIGKVQTQGDARFFGLAIDTLVTSGQLKGAQKIMGYGSTIAHTTINSSYPASNFQQ